MKHERTWAIARTWAFDVAVYGSLLAMSLSAMRYIPASVERPRPTPAYVEPAPAAHGDAGALLILTAADTEARLQRYEADVMAIPVETPSPAPTANNPDVTDEERNLLAKAVNKPYVTDEERDLLAKAVYGEARGCSRDEQALVVWTALNRLDDGRFGKDITAIITHPGQFAGYRAKYPVTDEILSVVNDAVDAYERGETAPVCPPYATKSDYKYFNGDSRHNYFR